MAEGRASNYRGIQTKTKRGKTCEYWDAKDVAEEYKYRYNPKSYPDDGLQLNYCRNPDKAHETIWCYVNDEHFKFDYCEPIQIEF